MKDFTGLITVFVVVTAVIYLLKDQLSGIRADYRVLLAANALLFLLGVVSLLLHGRALRNPNPQVFVRSVILANILKIFSLATAALVYISTAAKTTSTNAVFGALFLYIIYTWVEKRATIRLSKSRSS